jgi:hypothetical protein
LEYGTVSIQGGQFAPGLNAGQNLLAVGGFRVDVVVVFKAKAEQTTQASQLQAGK